MTASCRTVVLVDDAADVRMLLQVLLELDGFAVTATADGPAGLAAVRAERPDVVLLDVQLPGMDGTEVLRQLRADPATNTLPIIMLTTTDDPREVERCYKLGCNVYITKPVEYQAFIEAIRRLGLFLQVVKIPRPTTPQ